MIFYLSEIRHFQSVEFLIRQRRWAGLAFFKFQAALVSGELEFLEGCGRSGGYGLLRGRWGWESWHFSGFEHILLFLSPPFLRLLSMLFHSLISLKLKLNMLKRTWGRRLSFIHELWCLQYFLIQLQSFELFHIFLTINCSAISILFIAGTEMGSLKLEFFEICSYQFFCFRWETCRLLKQFFIQRSSFESAFFVHLREDEFFSCKLSVVRLESGAFISLELGTLRFGKFHRLKTRSFIQWLRVSDRI